MRAVWSFWSAPFARGSGWGWRSPLHHLLAWGLSVRVAAGHFSETALVTDSAGQALLVDGLGLEFTHVSTELDRLAGCDPGLWALGKLLAYSIQTEPFVHLDTDVFLWRPLPAQLVAAPVLAQHQERWSVSDTWPGPRVLEAAFALAAIDLPPEWRCARSRWGPTVFEANCGIAGGTHVEFIRYYAHLALDLVLNATYAPVWAAVSDVASTTPILEQFLLSACLEYHRSHPTSPFRGVHARYLFASSEVAFDAHAAATRGFTHLIADAKHDKRVAQRLEDRLEREDRELYRRCLRVAGA